MWSTPTSVSRSASSGSCSRTPTNSCSLPTRTAKARQSPGTWSKSSSRRCPPGGWSSTRSRQRRSPPPWQARARSITVWSRPTRPAACSTGSTATKSRPCCGRRSCRNCRRAASSPSRCGSSSTGRRSASRSALQGTGTSRQSSRRSPLTRTRRGLRRSWSRSTAGGSPRAAISRQLASSVLPRPLRASSLLRSCIWMRRLPLALPTGCKGPRSP